MSQKSTFKSKRAISFVLLTVFIILSVLCFAACADTRYSVDYCGLKDFFQGAQDKYAAGEQVTLYFDLIATDTDYVFYVDGEVVSGSYDEEKGYVISFVMPAHDIKVEFTAENSMTAPEPEYAEELLLVDYFEEIYGEGDDGGYYEITLSFSDAIGPDLLFLDEYIRENANTDEIQTRYVVPTEVFDECKDIAESYDMRSWADDETGTSMDGVYLVFQYYDGAEHIRVTTENMPGDCEQAFSDIKILLESYMSEDTLL